MSQQIDQALAQKTCSGQPVKDFPIEFTWHANYWPCIFDRQVELIRHDIRRARADEKLIIYLSCPISARGGGDQSTNIDIAKFVERRLLAQWGERFWILNPAQYQLESKEGTGVIEEHAKACGLELDKLLSAAKPLGGDYLRMWTKVLVEDQGIYDFDDPKANQPTLKNSGQHFDAFYFLGPRDVQDFFLAPGLVWKPGWQDDSSLSLSDKLTQLNLRKQWRELRRQYLRFYGLRASVNFSLGSHDEWEIFRQINLGRREKAIAANGDNAGVAEQLAAFFDQKQLDPGAAEAPLSRGYAMGSPKCTAREDEST
jgi:hypothetical protein